MVLQCCPTGCRDAGTQRDRDDNSEAFPLIRPVPLTLLESTITSIYRVEVGAGGQGRGPTGWDHTTVTKDLPGKLPADSRRRAVAAATAALLTGPETALCSRTLWMVWQHHCEVCALDPTAYRGDSALADTVDEKAWTTSQRPLPIGDVLDAPCCPRHRIPLPRLWLQWPGAMAAPATFMRNRCVSWTR